jgi:predicted flavoprotein YhiN
MVFDRVGELVVTDTGLEGSVVYAASSHLRDAIARQGRATLHLKRRRAVTLAQEVLVATRRGWQADEGESACAHASRRPARSATARAMARLALSASSRLYM